MQNNNNMYTGYPAHGRQEDVSYCKNITVAEYKEELYRIKTLLKRISASEVQDVILVQEKPIQLRMKGQLTTAMDLPVWTDRTFSVFLGNVTSEGIPGRVLPKPYKEGSSDLPEIDPTLTDDLLAAHNYSYDYSVKLAGYTLRVHLFYSFSAKKATKSVPSMMIRVINTKIPTWEELHMPKKFKEVTKLKSGLALFSGHVGAGKSTTVATLLNNLNMTSDTNKVILTVEHPIEYIYKNQTCQFIQRGVGYNVPSYGKATDDAMRENADIVVIGELRSAEEMDNALRLAEIGKLVIATIHSNSVADTPERFVSSFPGDVQENVRARLRDNLVCIVHQNLEVIDGTQYPVVEGFLIKSDQAKSTLMGSMNTRQQLAELMHRGSESWIVDHRTAFDEMCETVKFEDIQAAKNALVPRL